jgi:hypothetical protein
MKPGVIPIDKIHKAVNFMTLSTSKARQIKWKQAQDYHKTSNALEIRKMTRYKHEYGCLLGCCAV